jgi:hypothetical protein
MFTEMSGLKEGGVGCSKELCYSWKLRPDFHNSNKKLLIRNIDVKHYALYISCHLKR